MKDGSHGIAVGLASSPSLAALHRLKRIIDESGGGAGDKQFNGSYPVRRRK